MVYKKGREFTRGKVRERDNYKCQDCGKERTPEFVVYWGVKSLDVHHLNGLCGKMSKAYDKVEYMSNLITLCHKCHYHRHDFNGYTEKWYKNVKRLSPRQVA